MLGVLRTRGLDYSEAVDDLDVQRRQVLDALDPSAMAAHLAVDLLAAQDAENLLALLTDGDPDDAVGSVARAEGGRPVESTPREGTPRIKPLRRRQAPVSPEALDESERSLASTVDASSAAIFPSPRLVGRLRNAADWKARAQGIEELSAVVQTIGKENGVSPAAVAEGAATVAELLAALIDDSNFKIAVTALQATREVINRASGALDAHLGVLTARVLDKFKDSKIVIRQHALQVTFVVASTRPVGEYLGQVAPYLDHRSPTMREHAALACTQCVLARGDDVDALARTSPATLRPVVGGLAVVLSDALPRPRAAAAQALTALLSITGEGVVRTAISSSTETHNLHAWLDARTHERVPIPRLTQDGLLESAGAVDASSRLGGSLASAHAASMEKLLGDTGPQPRPLPGRRGRPSMSAGPRRLRSALPWQAEEAGVGPGVSPGRVPAAPPRQGRRSVPEPAPAASPVPTPRRHTIGEGLGDERPIRPMRLGSYEEVLDALQPTARALESPTSSSGGPLYSPKHGPVLMGRRCDTDSGSPSSERRSTLAGSAPPYVRAGRRQGARGDGLGDSCADAGAASLGQLASKQTTQPPPLASRRYARRPAQSASGPAALDGACADVRGAGASRRVQELGTADLLPLPGRAPEAELRSALDRCKAEDWVVQYEAINTLRRLVQHHAEPALLSDKDRLRECARQVATLCESLRSAIARNAVLLCAELFGALGRALDGELEVLLPVLIRRVAGNDLFLATEAARALSSMATHAGEGRAVAVVLAHYMGARAPGQRAKCAVIVDLCAGLHGARILASPQADRVVRALCAMAGDGGAEARAAARHAVAVLSAAARKAGPAGEAHMDKMLSRALADCDTKVARALSDAANSDPATLSAMSLVPSTQESLEQAPAPQRRPPGLAAAAATAPAAPLRPETEDAFKAMLAEAKGSDWRQRLDATLRLANAIAERPEPIRRSRYAAISLDVLAQRCSDGNSKVRDIGAGEQRRARPTTDGPTTLAFPLPPPR